MLLYCMCLPTSLHSTGQATFLELSVCMPCVVSYIVCSSSHALQTVSFDWFLSGLEWIIYLEFCYLNFCLFTSKYYRISDLGLTFPHFEFSSLYLDIFDQNLRFLCKKFQFWSNISKYRLKNSKCGRVKPRSDIL